MKDAPERHCVGQTDLFLSTFPADHERAAKLCGTCPAFDKCRRESDQWLNDAHGLGVDGTWAGTLYKNGREVNAQSRCEHCGLRAKRKESHYCSVACAEIGRMNRRGVGAA